MVRDLAGGPDASLRVARFSVAWGNSMRGSSIAGDRRDGLFQAAETSALLWGNASPFNAPIFRLFGIAFRNTTLDGAVDEMLFAARARRKTQVVFVNAHVINTAATDPAYKAVLQRANLCLADGSGMALAARAAGTPFLANTNGTDLFPVLCREAVRSGRKVFLLGGRDGVAHRAAETIRNAGYGEAIAGTHHGYFEAGSAGEQAAIDAVNASGADIVLVAMGVPMQDTWIALNAGRMTAPVLAGVGGLFDFFAGEVSRAPLPVRAVGMEWAWRLALEPARLWKRYIIGNAVFLARLGMLKAAAGATGIASGTYRAA